MPTGEAFTDGQLREISSSLSTASAESGLHFSAFVGNTEGSPRDYAGRLLVALGDRAPVGVLILVSPGDRRLEIVTGLAAGRRVPDRACALAALSMRTAFVGGDLAGGIVTGVRMLAEAAGESRAMAGTSHTGGTPPAIEGHVSS
ncbi:MAG: DUF5130 family protein [Frankiaceae bacterium]